MTSSGQDRTENSALAPSMKTDIVCACIRDDAHDCWRARYSLPMCESVEADGGPCECVCHDYDPEEP